MQDASFARCTRVFSVHTYVCKFECLFICLPRNINYPFRKMIRKQQTFQLKLFHNPYISLIIIVVGGLFAPRAFQRKEKTDRCREKKRKKHAKSAFQFLVLIAAEKPSAIWVFCCNKMLIFIHVESFLEHSPIFVLSKWTPKY